MSKVSQGWSKVRREREAGGEFGRSKGSRSYPSRHCKEPSFYSHGKMNFQEFEQKSVT